MPDGCSQAFKMHWFETSCPGGCVLMHWHLAPFSELFSTNVILWTTNASQPCLRAWRRPRGLFWVCQGSGPAWGLYATVSRLAGLETVSHHIIKCALQNKRLIERMEPSYKTSFLSLPPVCCTKLILCWHWCIVSPITSAHVHLQLLLPGKPASVFLSFQNPNWNPIPENAIFWQQLQE